MIVKGNGVDIRILETPHTLCILVTEVHAQKNDMKPAKTKENVHTNNPPETGVINYEITI